MTCQVNPEGRQQHLSSQGDEHHDEEQAQFVAGHRHQKARAEHRAQDRAERDRSGDYRIDIATREIGDAAGRRRRPIMKFDVAETP